MSVKFRYRLSPNLAKLNGKFLEIKENVIKYENNKKIARRCKIKNGVLNLLENMHNLN
jgi:hypothetical protein